MIILSVKKRTFYYFLYKMIKLIIIIIIIFMTLAYLYYRLRLSINKPIYGSGSQNRTQMMHISDSTIVKSEDIKKLDNCLCSIPPVEPP